MSCIRTRPPPTARTHLQHALATDGALDPRRLATSTAPAGCAGLYRDSTCTSLFFIPEALQFLDFVLHTVAGVPHLNAVAHFERALFRTKEVVGTSVYTPLDVTALLPSQVLHRHEAAALISFSAPPEQFLHALLQGLPVPAPDNRARMPC